MKPITTLAASAALLTAPRRYAPDARRNRQLCTNVYNRDYFGCYDIENTKTVYRLYTEAVDAAAKKGVADPDLAGVAVVERFVWEHDFNHSNPNNPDFFTDTCQSMKPFVKKDNAYVVKETVEWDGVGQLACLWPANSFAASDRSASGRSCPCRRPLSLKTQDFPNGHLERHLAGEVATGEAAGRDFAKRRRLGAAAGDGVTAARMEVAA
jgi:hypothetical protein